MQKSKQQFFALKLQFLRLWWIATVVVSLYFCGSSIRDVFLGWTENPVTMNLAEGPALISDIPFPTVTICVDNKARMHKLNISSASDLMISYLLTEKQ